MGEIMLPFSFPTTKEVALVLGPRPDATLFRRASLLSRGPHRHMAILHPQPRRPLTGFSGFRCGKKAKNKVRFVGPDELKGGRGIIRGF
jgi:hypothetical protein